MKEYSVASKKVWKDKYNKEHANIIKLWDDKGYTKKFTLDEALEIAEQMHKKLNCETRVYKGWTVIEVFE